MHTKQLLDREFDKEQIYSLLSANGMLHLCNRGISVGTEDKAYVCEFTKNHYNACAYNKKNKVAVAIAPDRIARIDLNDNESKHYANNSTAVDISADGSCELYANGKDIFTYSDARYYGFTCEAQIHTAPITSIRLSPTAKYLLFGSTDGSVILYDMIARKNNVLYNDPNTIVHSVDMANNVYVAGSSKAIHIFNTADLLKKLLPSQLIMLIRAKKEPFALRDFAPFKTMIDEMSKKNATLQESINTHFKLTEECPICSEKLCSTTTDCNHPFCEKCLIDWLTNNDTCPTCRATIITSKKTKPESSSSGAYGPWE